MAEIVVMPKIGLTAREAVLVEWLVDEGAPVRAGEVLFEVETDKITNEIESPASGVLLRRIAPDAIVPVGEPIAVIGEAGEDVSGVVLFDPTTAAQPEGIVGQNDLPPGELHSPDAGDVALPTAPAVGGPASPVARKLAVDLRVDLSTLTGTGPGGRITRTDVEKAAGTPVAGGEDTPGTREKPTKLRQAIAAAMSLSATVPQFSLERDVDVGALLSAVKSHSPAGSSSVSLADAVGLATARAITRHAVFLRSWSDGAFEIRPSVNLGLAVAVEDGLIVPVLRDANALTLEGFSRARRDLQERTLAGKLNAAESSGAVFTISNLGPLGVDRFRALVNPPESGILAVGRAREEDGRTILTLNLSADHRVVDGAQGARLLAEIARFLEEPGGRAELLGADA